MYSSNHIRHIILKQRGKSRIYPLFLSWALALALALIFNGCADVSIVPSPPIEASSVASQDNFCIDDPLENESFLKIMFVVDISGSNGATDKNGSKRADNIDRFVDDLSLQDQKHYQYGIILFNNEPRALIHDSGDKTKATFTKDSNEVKLATNKIRANPFRGGTQYGLALMMTKSAIENDMLKFPDERSKYIVFLISDGRPNDGDNKSTVSSLVNTVGGSEIYLSTAFYGNGGAGAIKILEDMAKVGGGNFVNFESGDKWDLDQLFVTNTVIPWSLKEFLVYNLNAGFCFDGRVDVDSDADGMCDRDERTMNNLYAEELKKEGKTFDPANRFSFGDGYGDFFHWLRFRYPGTLFPACQDRSDQDFDLLTKCEEHEIRTRSGRTQGLTMTRGNPEAPEFDSSICVKMRNFQKLGLY